MFLYFGDAFSLPLLLFSRTFSNLQLYYLLAASMPALLFWFGLNLRDDHTPEDVSRIVLFVEYMTFSFWGFGFDVRLLVLGVRIGFCIRLATCTR